MISRAWISELFASKDLVANAVLVSSEYGSNHFCRTRKRQGDHGTRSECLWRVPQAMTGSRAVAGAGEGPSMDAGAGDEVPLAEAKRRGKGLKRGLRKPLEPGVEFKAYLSEATLAFTAYDFDKAEISILEALRLNPEMFQAHNLLAEIHLARGESQKALIAAFNGAHTRPRDTAVWQRLATMITRLGDETEDSATLTKRLIYCYSRILTIDKDNVEVRFQRAMLNIDLGLKRKAIMDLELILRLQVTDTRILRDLAKLYTDIGLPEKALEHYRNALAVFYAEQSSEIQGFDWSDANIFGELLLKVKAFDEGLVEIKRVARWLLHRGFENFWDEWTQDDREWDDNDRPRRILVDKYDPNLADASLYGKSLPFELRVLMGLFRLLGDQGNTAEAVHHFQMIEQAQVEDVDCSTDFSGHFRVIGLALKAKGHYQEALHFLRPIATKEVEEDPRLWLSIALCMAQCDMLAEAANHYRSILEALPHDLEANSAHLKITQLGEAELLSSVAKSELISAHAENSHDSSDDFVSPDETKLQDCSDRVKQCSPTVQLQDESSRSQELTYSRCVALWKLWNGCGAKDKSNGSQNPLGVLALRAFLQITILHAASFSNINASLSRPPTKAGVGSSHQSYSDLEIDAMKVKSLTRLHDLLSYALESAKLGDRSESNAALSIALATDFAGLDSANIFLTRLCSLACALQLRDDEALCQAARWFVMEFQFVTDTYRLFSAVNRLCHNANQSFNASPTQKFVLRQIKAVDFSLEGGTKRRSLYDEKATLKTNQDGLLNTASDLDTSLLMLYGNILYAGKSFSYAINYFLRALAADPDNASIKFSIGLAYLHWSMKRQAENRHYIIAQGFSFISQYYVGRLKQGSPVYRCEAEYNLGRAFQLLGLDHFATIHYQRCLDSAADDCTFTYEAAIGLQAILVHDKNFDQALALTRHRLVL